MNLYVYSAENKLTNTQSVGLKTISYFGLFRSESLKLKGQSC